MGIVKITASDSDNPPDARIRPIGERADNPAIRRCSPVMPPGPSPTRVANQLGSRATVEPTFSRASRVEARLFEQDSNSVPSALPGLRRTRGIRSVDPSNQFFERRQDAKCTRQYSESYKAQSVAMAKKTSEADSLTHAIGDPGQTGMLPWGSRIEPLETRQLTDRGDAQTDVRVVRAASRLAAAADLDSARLALLRAKDSLSELRAEQESSTDDEAEGVWDEGEFDPANISGLVVDEAIRARVQSQPAVRPQVAPLGLLRFIQTNRVVTGQNIVRIVPLPFLREGDITVDIFFRDSLPGPIPVEWHYVGSLDGEWLAIPFVQGARTDSILVATYRASPSWQEWLNRNFDGGRNVFMLNVGALRQAWKAKGYQLGITSMPEVYERVPPPALELRVSSDGRAIVSDQFHELVQLLILAESIPDNLVDSDALAVLIQRLAINRFEIDLMLRTLRVRPEHYFIYEEHKFAIRERVGEFSDRDIVEMLNALQSLPPGVRRLVSQVVAVPPEPTGDLEGTAGVTGVVYISPSLPTTARSFTAYFPEFIPGLQRDPVFVNDWSKHYSFGRFLEVFIHEIGHIVHSSFYDLWTLFRPLAMQFPARSDPGNTIGYLENSPSEEFAELFSYYVVDSDICLRYVTRREGLIGAKKLALVMGALVTSMRTCAYYQRKFPRLVTRAADISIQISREALEPFAFHPIVAARAGTNFFRLWF